MGMGMGGKELGWKSVNMNKGLYIHSPLELLHIITTLYSLSHVSLLIISQTKSGHIHTAMESSFASLSLLLLFLTFSSLVFSDGDDYYTGVFNMKAGSDCKYNVMNFDEDGIVGFRVQCSCPGTRKRLSYSCAYFGKPNICPGFNDTTIARANFYSELASYVKGKRERERKKEKGKI